MPDTLTRKRSAVCCAAPVRGIGARCRRAGVADAGWAAPALAYLPERLRVFRARAGRHPCGRRRYAATLTAPLLTVAGQVLFFAPRCSPAVSWPRKVQDCRGLPGGCHHLLSPLWATLQSWPPGAAAARTESPSSIGALAAIPNATAIARACGAGAAGEPKVHRAVSGAWTWLRTRLELGGPSSCRFIAAVRVGSASSGCARRSRCRRHWL